MATKTRIYAINELKLTDIRGFLASSVSSLGVVAKGNLTVIADESTFTNLTGLITVSGKVTSVTASSTGLPVSIPNFETEFINKTAVIDPITRQVVQDDDKSTRIITLTSLGLTKIKLDVKIKMKGIRAFFATDITLSGIAELTEDTDSVQPPVNPDPDIPVPQPPVSTEFRPNIGVSGLTYYWPLAKSEQTLKPALDSISQTCDSLGIPKNVVAFTLEVHSDGGRPGAGVDWRSHFESRCNMLPEVVQTIHSYGFGTVIFAWNSNTPGKGYSRSWPSSPSQSDLNFILDNIRKLVKSVGSSRTMWSLCNENDSSTPESFRSRIRGLKSELSIPDDRYLSADEHPSSTRSLPSLRYPPQTFTSDNGGIISELYENRDYWNASGFNVAAHNVVVDKYGSSVPKFFYNLVLSETIVKHKAKWYDVLKNFKSKLGNLPVGPSIPGGPDIPAPPAVSNGLLPSQVTWLTSRGRSYSNAKIVFNITSARMEGKRLVFTTDRRFPTSWRLREKGVNSVGFLIRKIGNKYVGGKCEWCVESRGWYDVYTNVTNEGYNGLTVPAKGEVVWCGIGAPDSGSECSSIVPFKWEENVDITKTPQTPSTPSVPPPQPPPQPPSESVGGIRPISGSLPPTGPKGRITFDGRVVSTLDDSRVYPVKYHVKNHVNRLGCQYGYNGINITTYIRMGKDSSGNPYIEWNCP